MNKHFGIFILVSRDTLSFGDFFEEGGGDVGGDDEGGDASEGDGDTVLAGDTDNTTSDSGEGTIGDEDFLVGEEIAPLGVDGHDMGILETGGPDEGLHLVVGDGEGWVAVVEGYGEVVVVEREEGAEGCVTDEGVGLVGGDIGKDEVEEGAEYALLLAIFEDLLPTHGEVGIDAVLDEVVCGLLFPGIGDAEDVPLFRWVGGIFYRHPCL